MRKHILLLNLLSIAIFGIIFTTSCNSVATSPETGTRSDSLAKVENDTAKKSSYKIEGVFHILWTDTTNFIKSTDSRVKKKMTFKFFVNDDYSLTLHGWLHDNTGTDLPNTQDLELWVGNESTEKFGPGTYFGNQVLKRDVIDLLIGKARAGEGEYVIFIPNVYEDLFRYRIKVTNRPPKDIKITDFSEKEILAAPQTNPSPPRGSN